MSEPSQVNVLLVDDNPAKLLALQTMLAPLGENLVSVTSGSEALKQLLDRPFASVVLDVNMPGMDGYETAQLIRGRPRTSHTPIIFVSAINLADTDALRGYSLGAVDYITAPIIPEVLRAKVSVFVDLFRKTEEARRHARAVEERTRQLEASQQQLRLAERMAAIGTLSAGLGHDMGNLLLPVQMQLESLNLDALPGEAANSLRSISSCVGQLRRLASGLRLLALDPDDTSTMSQTTLLDQWWPEVMPMLKNALPRGVSFQHEFEPGLPPVRLAPHLITQAVFNLVQNAGDAMRARGSGTVRVWCVRGKGGRTLRLGVSDDGPGMTPEVRARCLEPFFTTKTRTISTGLGLALVHGIVQRVGSTLDIDTRVGEGTTFGFELPLCAPLGREGLPPLLAVVTVGDQRTRSYLGVLLGSMGFKLAGTDSLDDPFVRLWVSSPDVRFEREAIEFVRRAPGRAALVLGEAPEGAAHESIVSLPAGAPAAQIRQRLAGLTSALRRAALEEAVPHACAAEP